MKLYKILLLTAVIIIYLTGFAYSQDIVIPADTEDIEAFDKALIINQDLEKKLAEQEKKKKEELAKTKKYEIDRQVAEEADKLKNLDKKSREEIKKKIEEKAHADTQNLNPDGSKKAADVIAPADSGKAAASTADPGPKDANK